eukprot:9191964-Karenia_brevis.AAC.1
MGFLRFSVVFSDDDDESSETTVVPDGFMELGASLRDSMGAMTFVRPPPSPLPLGLTLTPMTKQRNSNRENNM